MINKKEKLELYQKMLEVYIEEVEKDDWYVGFCYILMLMDSYYIIDELPELMAYKPVDALTFWWPYTDHEIRIKVLKEIIKKIKDDK